MLEGRTVATTENVSKVNVKTSPPRILTESSNVPILISPLRSNTWVWPLMVSSCENEKL